MATSQTLLHKSLWSERENDNRGHETKTSLRDLPQGKATARSNDGSFMKERMNKCTNGPLGDSVPLQYRSLPTKAYHHEQWRKSHTGRHQHCRQEWVRDCDGCIGQKPAKGMQRLNPLASGEVSEDVLNNIQPLPGVFCPYQASAWRGGFGWLARNKLHATAATRIGLSNAICRRLCCVFLVGKVRLCSRFTGVRVERSVQAGENQPLSSRFNHGRSNATLRAGLQSFGQGYPSVSQQFD